MMSLEAINAMNNKAAREAARKHRLPYVPTQQEIDDWVAAVTAADAIPRSELQGAGERLGNVEIKTFRRAAALPRLPFPYLGDYVPKGWRQIDECFVDSSGMSAEDEPAMTVRRFIEDEVAKHPGHGWAITSAGQFQVYIARYVPPEAGR